MNFQSKEAAERFQRLTDEIEISNTPQLLRGSIKNLRKTRTTQDFMFTQADRDKIAGGAVLAAAEGLGGLAVGMASSAMDTTDEADLLEFELDGKQIRAWVWWSIFQDGDDVDIVAEPMGGIWQAYGIRRRSDHILALHPHCSRGRKAHYRASAKWWLIISTPLIFLCAVITSIFSYFDGGYHQALSTLFFSLIFGGSASLLVSGVITYRVSRKYMGFVELAERIFTVFGWKDVKNIDLPAITKKNKKPGDPAALGTLFFRY